MDFMADYAAASVASAPQGALLLMRSVRSNKALLLTKVTKPLLADIYRKGRKEAENGRKNYIFSER
ncbi:MAG TPA: hypothetical protein DDY31_14515 [Lachnospiraceae bacterium]|nr:hypothetical protein [Lachnospiraceae bacterium]